MNINKINLYAIFPELSSYYQGEQFNKWVFCMDSLPFQIKPVDVGNWNAYYFLTYLMLIK